MHPIPKPQLSPVVNWSIPGRLIDQFPAAVVVINCPPFRGTIDRLPPSQRQWPHACRYPTGRSRGAVLGYDGAKPAESITRQKRHGLTTAKLRVASLGAGNV